MSILEGLRRAKLAVEVFKPKYSLYSTCKHLFSNLKFKLENKCTANTPQPTTYFLDSLKLVIYSIHQLLSVEPTTGALTLAEQLVTPGVTMDQLTVTLTVSDGKSHTVTHDVKLS